MRLSDAIVLGSALIRFEPSCFYVPRGNCGCIIGMGEAAMGAMSVLSYKKLWPWLSKPMPGKPLHSYAAEIGRRAYCVQEGTMTLEEVVDWVRSVEPAEEENKTPEPTEVSVGLRMNVNSIAAPAK